MTDLIDIDLEEKQPTIIRQEIYSITEEEPIVVPRFDDVSLWPFYIMSIMSLIYPYFGVIYIIFYTIIKNPWSSIEKPKKELFAFRFLCFMTLCGFSFYFPL